MGMFIGLLGFLGAIACAVMSMVYHFKKDKIKSKNFRLYLLGCVVIFFIGVVTTPTTVENKSADSNKKNTKTEVASANTNNDNKDNKDIFDSGSNTSVNNSNDNNTNSSVNTNTSSSDNSNNAPTPTTKVEETKPSQLTDSTNNNRIVYYVKNGKSYHYSKECSTLSRSKTILEGKLSDVISLGKSDPCDKCVH